MQITAAVKRTEVRGVRRKRHTERGHDALLRRDKSSTDGKLHIGDCYPCALAFEVTKWTR